MYNDEIYHYGKIGMKWHRHKNSDLKVQNKGGYEIKLKFKKHKTAKIVATTMTTIGTQKIADSLLLNKLGMNDTTRFIISNTIGLIGGYKVSNLLQDNF